MATLIAGVLGSIVTGIGTVILWLLHRGKFNAEVNKLEAEVDDLTSNRLIRELDRLSVSNDTLRQMVDTQQVEINELRRQAIGYAARETELTRVNQELMGNLAILRSQLAAYECGGV